MLQGEKALPVVLEIDALLLFARRWNLTCMSQRNTCIWLAEVTSLVEHEEARSERGRQDVPVFIFKAFHRFFLAILSAYIPEAKIGSVTLHRR